MHSEILLSIESVDNLSVCSKADKVAVLVDWSLVEGLTKVDFEAHCVLLLEVWLMQSGVDETGTLLNASIPGKNKHIYALATIILLEKTFKLILQGGVTSASF